MHQATMRTNLHYALGPAASSGGSVSCSERQAVFRLVHAEAFRPLNADGPCRSAARPTQGGILEFRRKEIREPIMVLDTLMNNQQSVRWIRRPRRRGNGW